MSIGADGGDLRESAGSNAAGGTESAPFRIEVDAVNKKEEREVHYASRVKVHPKRVNGTFRKVKWAVMIFTLTVYYFTPWLRWDRPGAAPDQAVLIDFKHQRLYFFFIEIWPQEFYYVTGLLILAAFGLFFVNSLFGRVWCGYACPQTVWVDLFVHIERWVEGDRSARIRLDKASWTLGKVTKRVIKHAIWLLIAASTGGAWIFYFGDAPTLLHQFPRGEAPITTYFSFLILTAFTYLLGGIAREQVCIYMCPWPRIQGAMFDEDSLAVSYRAYRGEERGPHKKGTSWEGRGDCIDCRQCVAACPMGIDIRDGFQLECIQCALCIDACDDIMDKVGRPRGLIGYESEANIERHTRGEPAKPHFIRPRTLLYSSLIVIIASVMLVTLLMRSTLDVNLIRDRNPVFVTLSDGSIRNGFTLRAINKELRPRTLAVSISGLDGATIVKRATSGEPDDLTLTVGADATEAGKFYVSVPRAALKEGAADLTFTLTDTETGEITTKATTFRGPK